MMKAMNENERMGKWFWKHVKKRWKSWKNMKNYISGMHIHHAVEPLKTELRRGLIERFLIPLFKLFK